MLLAIVLIGFGACKKDKPKVKTFADYTRQDIVNQVNNITADAVPYDAPVITNFNAGSIIFFKTTAGNYGKMEVLGVSAQYDLTLNVVVFDNNGAKLVNEPNKTFPLDGNKLYDLDMNPIIEDASASGDFLWALLQGIRTTGTVNGAKLYLFKP